MLHVIQAVDPTSTSYQLGYWVTRIGLYALVAFFIGKFILGRWRASRRPSPPAYLGVPGPAAPVQWPAPPDAAVPTAAVAETNPFAPPANGKHAR